MVGDGRHLAGDAPAELVGLTLASPVGGPGPIGAPARGGIVIAVFVAAAMTGLAVVGGVKWSRTHWWRYALIFWAIWVVIQTTFFTHLGGAGSGLWQSLGYWVAQQDVARGGQPWYYYLVITPVYEHLPMVLAIAGGVFYIRRRDKFGAFLAFWAAGSFFLYSMAGEKMPWLAVNLTLPMIVLAGKFLGDVVRMVQWRHVPGAARAGVGTRLRSGGVEPGLRRIRPGQVFGRGPAGGASRSLRRRGGGWGRGWCGGWAGRGSRRRRRYRWRCCCWRWEYGLAGY